MLCDDAPPLRAYHVKAIVNALEKARVRATKSQLHCGLYDVKQRTYWSGSHQRVPILELCQPAVAVVAAVARCKVSR